MPCCSVLRPTALLTSTPMSCLRDVQPSMKATPGMGGPQRTDAFGWAYLKLAVACAHSPPATGAVVLDVACFAEAERLYMLVKDTAVHGRPLTALVLPDVLVSGHWDWGTWFPWLVLSHTRGLAAHT